MTDAGVVMRKRKSGKTTVFYDQVVDIRTMAETGNSIVRAMGSRKRLPFSFDDLLFIPAQVSTIPKNREDPVTIGFVLGPSSQRPLTVSSPVILSGMSFGAVSRNVRIIISQTALKNSIAFNSGEGGVLDEEWEAKKYLIAQYSTGRFGITEKLLKEAAAVEIRFGQGAYPGKGSLLPAAKMTEEVAKIRGLSVGEDSYSPAHHPDITSSGDIREKVDWIRELTGGVPVGAKIGCGAVEKDLSVLVSAGVDFIAIDGFGAGTGATNPYVRDNVGIPLIAALPRASRFLKKSGVKDRITLIAGGGLRTSADIAKCLALGADAVNIGTAAVIAINCEQYRICQTGLCPTGVTTQEPGLVSQCKVERGIRRLSNFIRVVDEEVAGLTRVVGKTDIHSLDVSDLVSLNRDLCRLTGCQWLDGNPV